MAEVEVKVSAEEVLKKFDEFVNQGDFAGAFECVRANKDAVDAKLKAEGIRDALKKATKDRLILSFIDGAGFGSVKLEKSLVVLEKLLSFKIGSYALNKTWGLGKVVSLDDFYKRITVNFKTKPNHQFSYAAAADMLESAPQDHILMFRESDPTAFNRELKEQPADFVKRVLKSYGNELTVTRLEDIFVANGFVKAVNWKAFWDKARADLHRDKTVEVPAKRADPIRLKESVEDYGDKWMTAFQSETSPKLILADVLEYVAAEKGKKFQSAHPNTKAKINDRLAFAVTAARKVDDALYARLACLVTALGFANPSAAEMRDYLWERRRYIKAAEKLPAREVGSLIAFLADSDESKENLYRAIPDFCFTAVQEIVSQFGKEPACRAAIGTLMKAPKAPATLTTLLVGAVSKKGWAYADWKELPPLTIILTHAIALGEGRQGGETLKMQNIVRRLFGNTAWLEEIFKLLAVADKVPSEGQVLFFERFQASIAWDPSSHHTTVVRMTHIVPELSKHLVKVEKKKEYARVTSFRSFGLKKQEYLKLINEDMPENVRKIEFAKGFGDLSENAEYQYAKDEQRALMQKQTLMQADLEAVKPSEFNDATTDEVMPGVTVVITAAEGEKTYTILGEWDNDLEMGILSSKTRVAQNLLGKKVGDNFELPAADGSTQYATVKEIRELTPEVREWMKLPAGVQI